MLYLKIFEDKSFVETPLPSVFIFFTLSGFIFFSLNLVLEKMKNILKDDINKVKSYKIINENRP